jgi:citrate lyase subunit beta/citryl-CoA lyase
MIESPRTRSLLFTPGDDADKLQKIHRFDADGVVIDLEDSVPPTRKKSARVATREILRRLDSSTPSYVRVNAVPTDAFAADVEAVVGPSLRGIMIPKVENHSDLETAHAALCEAERQAEVTVGGTVLLLLIETARGLLNVNRLASWRGRTMVLCLGSVDLMRELRLSLAPGVPHTPSAVTWAQTWLVIASAANGLPPPIDGVFLDTTDMDSFRSVCEAARLNGMSGKLCIHPKQVAVANDAFRPTPEELQWNREVVEAYEASAADGRGVSQLHGRLIDLPVYRAASAVLAEHGSIGLDDEIDDDRPKS